jgi:hypothetical protein
MIMNDKTDLLPDIKLRFNIEHPSFEECYVYGYECALANLAEEENPFRAGSPEAEQWLDGWWAGTFGEEPLFNLSGEDELNAQMVQEDAANDQEYSYKHGFFTLVFEISGAIAASAIVGYQLLELVA